MRELPLPTVGATTYRRYTHPHNREEIGLVVNTVVQRREDGSIHSWTGLIQGANGYQPFGHLDVPKDMYDWHPVDWKRDGVAGIRPPTNAEKAQQLYEDDVKKYGKVVVVSDSTSQEPVDDGSAAEHPDGPSVPHRFSYSVTTAKDDLVEMCETFHLPADGTKKDLIARLDEFYAEFPESE